MAVKIPPDLKTIFKKLYLSVRERLWGVMIRQNPNLRGAHTYAPGHFYSPLLDIRSLGSKNNLPYDGVEWWENINLRSEEQRAYYEDLLVNFPPLDFPKQQNEEYRYFTENSYLAPADAFTLSAIIRKEAPRRIVEVGSGFSSAVMLDTLDRTRTDVALTFIEPYPERLHSLLSPADRARSTLRVQLVQEAPLSEFDQLEAGDLLFIDSSHVAKIGSDVTFILLRILPRLKAGVIVHFHDIFYPYSYPADWIRAGWAWNESMFLRAFLAGNERFQVLAFNSYAGQAFPELFKDRFPVFLENSGGSMWIKKLG